jgi:ATP-dependent helicase HrpB
MNSLYIIAPALDAGEKAEGFVHLAAPVTEELIRSECGRNIETVRRVEWDQGEGRIVSAIEERIGAILLSRKSFPPADAEAVPVLCEVIRTIPGVLSFSAAANQLQARVALIARTFPEESWPDLSSQRLLARPEEWLLPWLDGIRTSHALRTLDVLPALKAMLSWQQQRLLDERAPLQVPVPSGSKVKIDYVTGEHPVLAVKLQEMFGLADTPVIAEGRVKILLHLLSPAQRPVQITQDLKGFWNNGYPLVKKDLRGRYPRHPWPDDPWNAVPTKRAKRRGE